LTIFLTINLPLSARLLSTSDLLGGEVTVLLFHVTTLQDLITDYAHHRIAAMICLRVPRIESVLTLSKFSRKMPRVHQPLDQQGVGKCYKLPFEQMDDEFEAPLSLVVQSCRCECAIAIVAFNRDDRRDDKTRKVKNLKKDIRLM
jgi:hypothetical protein